MSDDHALVLKNQCQLTFNRTNSAFEVLDIRPIGLKSPTPYTVVLN